MPAPTHAIGRLADMTGLTKIVETNAHADPQVVYNRLRAQWGDVAPIELEPGINGWLVMGHEELVHVLRHERLFAKSSLHWRDYTEGRVKPDSFLGPFMFPRPNAWMTDGDEHRRVRAPLDDAVNSLRLRQVSNQVNEVCGTLIAEFGPSGHADLVSQYAFMIPAIVIGRLLGLDLETARAMHQALSDVFALNENTQAANDRLEAILLDLVQSRQAKPTGDMASVIVHHQNMRDISEAMHEMVLLISASNECTMAWIGGTLQLMLTDSRFARRLRGGRLGVDDALDEVLWRDPPIANLPARFALRDTELAGAPIGKGDALILCFAAANADPRVHSDDKWSELGNRAHLAWSAGPHMCPAHVPARVIVRGAVETALNQLRDLRLTVPAEELGRHESPWSRCPATLPVTFTPTAGTAQP
jgi:cytochrome P450